MDIHQPQAAVEVRSDDGFIGLDLIQNESSAA
jgi:hypothetical protein